jgi:hypothetical protein
MTDVTLTKEVLTAKVSYRQPGCLQYLKAYRLLAFGPASLPPIYSTTQKLWAGLCRWILIASVETLSTVSPRMRGELDVKRAPA